MAVDTRAQRQRNKRRERNRRACCSRRAKRRLPPSQRCPCFRMPQSRNGTESGAVKLAPKIVIKNQIVKRNLVGVRGFEPPTPSSRTRCATRLRYTPTSRAGRDAGRFWQGSYNDAFPYRQGEEAWKRQRECRGNRHGNDPSSLHSLWLLAPYGSARATKRISPCPLATRNKADFLPSFCSASIFVVTSPGSFTDS